MSFVHMGGWLGWNGLLSTTLATAITAAIAAAIAATIATRPLAAGRYILANQGGRTPARLLLDP